MKDVFMVRLDWSITDADGIDTELYEDYDEAYDRYKEIITEQLKNFWQGEVTFDTDGDPGEEYEFFEELERIRRVLAPVIEKRLLRPHLR